jgi:hypothetical protein
MSKKRKEMTETQRANFEALLLVVVEWYCLRHEAVSVKDLAVVLEWSESKVRATINLMDIHPYPDTWKLQSQRQYLRGYRYLPAKKYLAQLYKSLREETSNTTLDQLDIQCRIKEYRR